MPAVSPNRARSASPKHALPTKLSLAEAPAGSFGKPQAGHQPLRTQRTLLALLIGLGLGLGTPAGIVHAREAAPADAAATQGSAPASAPTPAQASTKASAGAQLIQTVAGVTEYRLANGLTVLLGPDEGKPTMTVNLVYKVGSRHEGPGEAGMAHLLEHMLFKGTEKIPDPKKELTRRGIEWNGTTWYDRTNYFGQFNSSDATRDWMLGWLADTMTNVRIDAGKLKSERPIVINEMQARDNNPGTALYQELMNSAYGFHPYGRSVIGVESDLDTVSPGNLQAFYKTYYRPDNAVLVITGQFDPADTLAAVEKAFGSIARPTTPIPQPYTLDPTQQGEREVVLRRSGGVPILLAGYHTPAAADRDSVALAMLAMMLTREPDGPLYQQLVKTGLAVNVGANTNNLFDPGMLIMAATLANESKRQQVWETLRKVVEDELPLDQEALDRTKLDIRNYMQRLQEDADGMATALTEAIAEGDWRLPFAQADWAQQMTLDEIRAAGKRWLVRDNRTLAWYLPTPKPVRAPAPSRPDIAALLKDHPWQKTEAFKADFALNPASITERTQIGELPFGLEYALMPRQTKGDRISLNLALQWGNLKNLDGRWREADLLGAMMLSGTKQLPRQAFHDRLRALDARLNLSASETGATLSLNVPAKNFDESLALAISALREPVFPADLLKENQERVLASIDDQREQPSAMVSEALAERAHAYPLNDPRHHRNLDETAADVRKQTPERLMKFWQDFAGASHGQVSAVGNFDVEKLKTTLQTLLGDWKSPQDYARIDTPYHGLPVEQVYLTTPDKANAVYVQTRNIPISEDHPDYPALSMAVRMFGGNPDARLANRLREKESISYGAYASLSAQRKIEDGSINIRAILAPRNLKRLEAAVQEEIDLALAKGFSQQELDSVRSALQDLRRQYLTDEGNVVSLLRSNLYWDETMKRWTDYDGKIVALTIDDVNAAFRKWFDPKKALTIAAGSFDAQGNPVKPAKEEADKASASPKSGKQAQPQAPASADSAPEKHSGNEVPASDQEAAEQRAAKP